MKCVKALWTVILLIYSKCAEGSLQEEIGEVTSSCCQTGSDFAREHPNGGEQSCSTVQLPEDVPDAWKTFCNLAMEGCCKDVYLEKANCTSGMKFAKTKQCGSPPSLIGQTCCEECSIGYLAGQAGGSQACTKIASEEEESSPNMLMRKKAYRDCCLEASKDINDEDKEELGTSPDLPPSITELATKASVCEQFAPDELCAHHCIPIPGSYKCECNPGFALMSDGKSCMKTQKNRCYPKNPCEQKCIDTGKEAKCTCKRGYKLNSDKRTCKDINECFEDKFACSEGMNCVNQLGSYKCVPKKNSKNAPLTSPTQIRGKCPVGFIWNSLNSVCDDINECDLPSPPCPKELCTNSMGSFKCKGGNKAVPLTNSEDVEDKCPTGFSSSGVDDECIDIDECLKELDDCNKQSQFCLNTDGSFVCHDRASKNCPPGFKANKKTGKCQDIDECAEDDSLCQEHEVCVNLPGKYHCKGKNEKKISKPRVNRDCSDGLRYNSVSFSCEDIDECAEGSHICDQYQTCQNTYGGHQCECKRGFELDPATMACVDIDECLQDELNNCDAKTQRCDNTIGSYTCFRIASCGTGYILQTNSGKCQDIDECVHKMHNCDLLGRDFVCVNLPGTFRCVRKKEKLTTTTLSPEYEYYDSDEETNENLTTQPKNEPSPKSFEPKTSSESTTSTTKASTVQTSTITSSTENTVIYSTTTSTPYTNIPDASTTPQNRRKMLPPKVIYLNKPNEPVRITGIRDKNGTIIVNAKELPKNTWTTIVGKDGAPNNRDKYCLKGYIMNNNGDCIDVNECAQGNFVCSPNEKCRNTDGGYVCDCADGFNKNPKTGWCEHITTTTAAPQRVPWDYQTYRPFNKYKDWSPCDTGFSYNTSTSQCEDIDECARGLAACGNIEICENTEGGYKCVCPPNWRLDHIRHRCVPLNREPAVTYRTYQEADHPDNVRPETKLTVGRQYGSSSGDRNRYTSPDIRRLPDSGAILTSCPWGYKLNDETQCVDIDECSQGTSDCGPKQICTNKPGGYICSCPSGHHMTGPKDCEDIDECALSQGRYCSPQSDCINTIGSYVCRCHAGLRATQANDKVCTDIDECAEGRTGSLCEHTCNNVWGSYRCSCHRGYRLAPDNRTCTDVDECKEYAGRNICFGKCYNEPGSYRCACPPGYRLGADKKSCIDIDECETGEATCANAGPNVICHNTRGSYKCHTITCPPGFELDEKKPRCLRNLICVVGDWDCARQRSSISYNFISFVSRLYIPPLPNRVDLFTLRGPNNSILKFNMKVVDVNHPPSITQPADISCFLMTHSVNQAVVSLVKSLEGPQTIHLELSMEMYEDGRSAGIAIANVIIYVSEYTF